MSHKSSPSKEFLEFYHLHNSQDTEKIDIANACWREMEKLYEISIKGRDELLVIAETFQCLANKQGCTDHLPKQMANLSRVISEAKALKEKEV